MEEQGKPKKTLAWGPIEGIIGSLLLFIGVQITVATLLYTVLSFMGWDSHQITDSLSNTGNMLQFLLSGFIALLTLGSLFWYLNFKKARPEDLGLVKPKLIDLGYVLMGAGMYIVGYAVIVSVVTELIPALDTEQLQDLGFSTSTVGNELFLIFLSLVVLAPIVEEVVVRGFLFTGLRSQSGFWVSALISSGLFGLAHLLGGEDGSTIWIAVLDTFILGMVLAYLREKSKSLWPCMGLHALKNFVAFMALFVFKIV